MVVSIFTAGVGTAVAGALGGGFLASIVGGAIGGAISGAIFGLIGASVRGVKILNASRKGLVIGKIGNFEQAAKSMNLSHYNGLKGYELVEKIFGKNLAAKIGWAHNKAFVKSVMRLGGVLLLISAENYQGLMPEKLL